MQADHGRVSSHDGHPNRGLLLQAVAIACLAVAWLGVSLRFYVRHKIVRKIALDDWLFLGSLGLFTFCISFVLAGVHYGTGQHIKYLRPEDAARAVKFWHCCECAFAITTTALKVAFGVFYLRVVHQRWQRYMLYCLISICVLFGIVYLFCIVFQCRPISYMWSRYNGGHGKCLLLDFIVWGSYCHSIMSAIVDWILALLPVFLVWNV